MLKILTATGLILLTAMSVLRLFHEPVPDFRKPALTITDPGLRQPTDIVRFKGRYVVSELYNNRLAIFDDLDLGNLGHFDPASVGGRFKSPHFLAVTPWDTLLISNGWGKSIVEITDLDGNGWKEFSGIDRSFNAPHGICVDDNGWIYVGDSLNSRLVRFRDMDGGDWEVFEDVDARISYIRELACRNGEIWASNSYENRPGLNPGEGSNLLKITDFASGQVEVVASFPDANATGMLPIDNDAVLMGLWGMQRRLALVDTRGPSTEVFPRLDLGTPYGTYRDEQARRIIVTYIGKLSAQERQEIGGIAVYR